MAVVYFLLPFRKFQVSGRIIRVNIQILFLLEGSMKSRQNILNAFYRNTDYNLDYEIEH